MMIRKSCVLLVSLVSMVGGIGVLEASAATASETRPADKAEQISAPLTARTSGRTQIATTVTVTVKASSTQRMSGGSLKSHKLGTLPYGYRTTAGCRIIGQKHSGVYGSSTLWWDTPVG